MSGFAAPAKSAAIAELFPRGVVAFEIHGPGDPARLRPEESALAAPFVPKRLAEFAAGRSCARAALAELGLARDVAIAINADRSPAWPTGFVGSISHTDGYCAAVASREAAFLGIGLDVERTGRVTGELWPIVFGVEERERLAGLEPETRARFATVVFGAKEAYYKCQFTISHAWVDFHDVVVTIDPSADERGRFDIRSAGTNPACRETLPVSGRFRVDGGVVSAAVAIER